MAKNSAPANKNKPAAFKKLKIIENLVAYLPNYGLDIGLGEVTTNIVDENDWANAWKQYYKTTRIGKNIVIKPTWEEYSPQSEDLVIDLDPGMAFGTGTHETTMMCIEGLEKAVKEAKPTSIMVDTFGTGKVSETKIVEIIRENFDLRPAGMIQMLDLRKPIYQQTAAYGHFGRTDIDLPWERLNKVEILKAYMK